MADDETQLLEEVEKTQQLLEADPSNASLHFQLGKAYFKLEEYESSAQALAEGREKAQGDAALVSKFDMWLRKCNLELEPEKRVAVDAAPDTSASDGTMNDSPPAPAAPAAPARPQIEHDWYQSMSHVTITLKIKNCSQEDVSTEFTPTSVAVTVKIAEGREVQHTFEPLYRAIEPDACTCSVSRYKIELALKKAQPGQQWAHLENAEGTLTTGGAVPPPPPQQQNQSSGGFYKKNWDQFAADLAKEEEDEKVEGDAALNKLFRDIYGKADDDTKRAMQKSYVESGGTVLSTNWSEVGSKHVDGTPPKGMEWANWK